MFTISGVEPRQPPERRKASILDPNTRASLRGDRTGRGAIRGGDADIGETRSSGRGTVRCRNHTLVDDNPASG